MAAKPCFLKLSVEELIEFMLAKKKLILNCIDIPLNLIFKKKKINSSRISNVVALFLLLSYRVSYAVASDTIDFMQTIFFVIGNGGRRSRNSCSGTTSDSVSSVLL